MQQIKSNYAQEPGLPIPGPKSTASQQTPGFSFRRGQLWNALLFLFDIIPPT